MDYLLDIIKKIACFYVFASFILNLVNDERYKKYINMFTGLIMIILVMKPVINMFSSDNQNPTICQGKWLIKYPLPEVMEENLY